MKVPALQQSGLPLSLLLQLNSVIVLDKLSQERRQHPGRVSKRRSRTQKSCLIRGHQSLHVSVVPWSPGALSTEAFE